MNTDTGLRGLALLDAAIAQIEQHPETWRQSALRCETGMCVAGHGADLAGGRWATGRSDDFAGYLLPEEDDPPGDVWDYPFLDGPLVAAWNRAKRLMGLTDDQADDLFAIGNTLADIRLIRDELAARGLS